MKLCNMTHNVKAVFEGVLLEAAQPAQGQAYSTLLSLLSEMDLKPEDAQLVDTYLSQALDMVQKKDVGILRLSGKVPEVVQKNWREGLPYDLTFTELMAIAIFKANLNEGYVDVPLRQAYGLRNAIENDLPGVVKWDMKYPKVALDSFDLGKAAKYIKGMTGRGQYLKSIGTPYKQLLQKAGLEPIAMRGGVSNTIIQIFEVAQILWGIYKAIRDGQPLTDFDRFFKYKLSGMDISDARDQILAQTEPEIPTEAPKPEPVTPAPSPVAQQPAQAAKPVQPPSAQPEAIVKTSEEGPTQEYPKVEPKPLPKPEEPKKVEPGETLPGDIKLKGKGKGTFKRD